MGLTIRLKSFTLPPCEIWNDRCELVEHGNRLTLRMGGYAFGTKMERMAYLAGERVDEYHQLPVPLEV